MNFDDAIQAHSSWKMKLSQYIKKPDGSIKSKDVGKDNLCDLGKWIYSSDATKFSSTPEFQKLKQHHMAFHKAAAEIVDKADSGQQVQEEMSLGAKSPYAKCSMEVVQSIMAMKTKINT